MRDWPQRILVGVLGTVVLALIAGCPKPAPPTPIGPPDASDASPAPVPPPHVPCSLACDHAESVCPGSGNPCLDGCNRLGGNDHGYAPCVLAAASCAELKCDASVRAAAKR